MLDHIHSIIEKFLFGNRNLSYPLFAATGGATATVITTNAMNFTIKGRVYTKAATAAIALTGSTQAAGTTRYTLAYINAAGTIAFLHGTAGGDIPTIKDVIAAGIDPLTIAVFGVMKIVNTTNPFVPGTTNLNAAGVTPTFADVSCIPDNAAAIGM